MINGSHILGFRNMYFVVRHQILGRVCCLNTQGGHISMCLEFGIWNLEVWEVVLKIEFCRSPVQSCEFLYQNSTKTGPLFRLQVVKDSRVLKSEKWC
jgi:hypothetical protein